MKSGPYKAAWPLVVAAWLLSIGGGYAWFLRYSFTAGEEISAPRHLPAAWHDTQPARRAQLYLALHPRCPCSKATLHELARIMTAAPNAADITALMFLPETEPESWAEGDLKDECQRLGCRIILDREGQLARNFGGLTSGQVALYDAHRVLRYQGGITAGRGHVGDNAGGHAVLAILQGSQKAFPALPVFGCPLSKVEGSKSKP